MSRICPVLFLCLIFCASYGQQLVNDVVGISGEEISNSEIVLNTTSGELVSSTINNSEITLTQGFQQTSQLLYLMPIAILQGASVGTSDGLMRDDLRTSNYLPNISPYNDKIKISDNAFSNSGNNAVVDWVTVKLRNAAGKVISEKNGLIKRDGFVLSADGMSPLQFTAQNNNYFIEVNHRNHLGVMSASPIYLSKTITTVDFTDSSFSTFGTNAQAILSSGDRALWAGNVNDDRLIQYTGATPDPAGILAYVLNSPSNFLNLPSFPISGYSKFDVDMNGFAQYTGTNPDTPLILQNVLTNPGNFLGLPSWPINEQTPNN